MKRHKALEQLSRDHHQALFQAMRLKRAEEGDAGSVLGDFLDFWFGVGHLHFRAEEEVLPLCVEHGLGFTPFSPLAGGWLTGKYRRGEPPPEGSRMTQRPEPYEHLRTDAVFDGLEHLAERGDPAVLALAWLLGDPRISALVVGPRRPEHLRPAVAAARRPLDDAVRRELASLFPAPPPAA